MESRWIVWVGGVYDGTHATREIAEILAEEWREEGYDDVVVEEYK